MMDLPADMSEEDGLVLLVRLKDRFGWVGGAVFTRADVEDAVRSIGPLPRDQADRVVRTVMDMHDYRRLVEPMNELGRLMLIDAARMAWPGQVPPT